jgi:hypothetical protein
VAILYGGSTLACRHCRKLTYDSQHDSGFRRIGAPGSGNPHEARRLSKPSGFFSRKAQWNALARTYHRFYREAAGRECLLTAGLESWLNRFRRKNFSERNGRRKMLELALR